MFIFIFTVFAFKVKTHQIILQIIKRTTKSLVIPISVQRLLKYKMSMSLNLNFKKLSLSLHPDQFFISVHAFVKHDIELLGVILVYDDHVSSEYQIIDHERVVFTFRVRVDLTVVAGRQVGVHVLHRVREDLRPRLARTPDPVHQVRADV